MAITQDILTDFIAEAPQDILREVLEQSELDFDSQDSPNQLADRLTKALWWRTTTPLGYQLKSHTFESILKIYADKLDMTFTSQDAWQQLKELTDHLLPPHSEVDVNGLSESLQKRLKRSAWKTVTGLGGTATATGSRWAATRLLASMSGPMWKWIHLVPKLGPVLVGVRTTAGWVASLSGPIAIAMAIYTVNNALGPKWDEGLPLLLGIGLIQRHQGQMVCTTP